MSECAVSELTRIPNHYYLASLRRMLRAELYVIEDTLAKLGNDC